MRVQGLARLILGMGAAFGSGIASNLSCTGTFPGNLPTNENSNSNSGQDIPSAPFGREPKASLYERDLQELEAAGTPHFYKATNLSLPITFQSADLAVVLPNTTGNSPILKLAPFDVYTEADEVVGGMVRSVRIYTVDNNNPFTDGEEWRIALVGLSNIAPSAYTQIADYNAGHSPGWITDEIDNMNNNNSGNGNGNSNGNNNMNDNDNINNNNSNGNGNNNNNNNSNENNNNNNNSNDNVEPPCTEITVGDALAGSYTQFRDHQTGDVVQDVVAGRWTEVSHYETLDLANCYSVGVPQLRLKEGANSCIDAVFDNDEELLDIQIGDNGTRTSTYRMRDAGVVETANGPRRKYEVLMKMAPKDYDINGNDCQLQGQFLEAIEANVDVSTSDGDVYPINAGAAVLNN